MLCSCEILLRSLRQPDSHSLWQPAARIRGPVWWHSRYPEARPTKDLKEFGKTTALFSEQPVPKVDGMARPAFPKSAACYHRSLPGQHAEEYSPSPWERTAEWPKHRVCDPGPSREPSEAAAHQLLSPILCNLVILWHLMLSRSLLLWFAEHTHGWIYGWMPWNFEIPPFENLPTRLMVIAPCTSSRCCKRLDVFHNYQVFIQNFIQQKWCPCRIYKPIWTVNVL